MMWTINILQPTCGHERSFFKIDKQLDYNCQTWYAIMLFNIFYVRLTNTNWRDHKKQDNQEWSLDWDSSVYEEC